MFGRGHLHEGGFGDFGFGGHHHHHHHQNGGIGLAVALGGLTLGAVALGAEALMNNDNQQQRYVQQPPRIVYVDPAEQARREAERVRVEAENQARMQILREEENLRQERYRAEQARLRALEEQTEQARLEKWKQHLDFLSNALEQDFDSLYSGIAKLPIFEQPSNRFQNTPQKGLPSRLNGSSLFSIILGHPGLSTQNKNDLLEVLINREDYGQFKNYLLDDNSIIIMLNDESLHPLLLNLYINKIHHIRIQHQENLWIALIPRYAEQLFNYLLLKRKPSELLQFISCWFDAIQTTEAVEQRYNSLVVKLGRDFFPEDIKKMADLRILAMKADFGVAAEVKQELPPPAYNPYAIHAPLAYQQYVSVAPNPYPVYQPALAVDQANEKAFLRRSRHFGLFSCIESKQEAVYRKICRKDPNAPRALKELQNKTEAMVNEHLKKGGEIESFHFRR